MSISELKTLHWRRLVSRLIKAEMSKRGVKYLELSRRLESFGIVQSEDNLRNKINKGILGADLLLAIIVALDVRSLGKELLLDILSGIDKSN